MHFSHHSVLPHWLTKHMALQGAFLEHEVPARSRIPTKRYGSSGSAFSHWTAFTPCSISHVPTACLSFPGGSPVKNPPANAGDAGSVPWLGRSPGEGNGNPLQYSYLGNPMDGGVWWATVHGVAKEPDMTWRLNKQQPYAFCVADMFFISFNTHCTPQQNKCYYREEMRLKEVMVICPGSHGAQITAG